MHPEYKFHRFLVLLLFVFIHTVKLSFSQTPTFRSYGVAENLSSSTIYFIHQDKKGFIWTANDNGVSRFDGKSFENFTQDNGLCENEIMQIREDSYGRLWFMALNGRVSIYKDGRFYNDENSNLLKNLKSSNSYIHFYEDAQKRIWLSTNNHNYYCINDNKVKKYVRGNSNLPINKMVFFEDNVDHLWGVSEDHFYIINKEQLAEQSMPYYPVNTNAIYFAQNSKTLYFIAKEGLVSMINGRQKLIKPLLPKYTNNNLSAFTIDKSNRAWLSIFGEGLFSFAQFTEKPNIYLKEEFISFLKQDNDKNLWVGTLTNGLFQLSQNARNLLSYTKNDGLTDESVHSIYIDSINRIWLGLKTGHINIIDGNKITVKKAPSEKINYNPIKQIQADPKTGSVWFASDLHVSEITSIYSVTNDIKSIREKSDDSYAVKSFSFDQDNKLAIATASGVFVFKNKSGNLVFDKKSHIDKSYKYFPNRSYKVLFDKYNALWFSNVEGLNYYHNGILQKYGTKDKRLMQRITDIDEYNDKLIIATLGNGIFIFDKKKIVRQISTKNGLNSNICRKVFVNGNDIWCVTGKGINKIKIVNNKVFTSSYTAGSGLISNEIYNIYVRNKNVYVATKKGLSVFNEAQFIEYQSPPKVYFKEIVVKGKVQKDTSNLIIPYQNNKVIVKFTAINYQNYNQTLFQYRINDQSNWTTTNNNTLEFALLEPGVYHIQLRASRYRNYWSKPVYLSFTIDTPFYKSNWFIILLYSSIIFTISYIIYIINKNQKQKEKDELLIQNKLITLEQKALQAMMNPHFVFNVMNSIQHFINTNKSKSANKLLTGFARLIRKNLDICIKGQITLEDEFEYLGLYLSMEKLRFGEKMDYRLTIDEDIDADEILLPSMLLQPFVENAIWHGIMPKEGKGNVNIDVKLVGDYIKIQIEDDGVGIENSRKDKNPDYVSRGMSLTNERIQLINKLSVKAIQIEIQQPVTGGTIVIIMSPI